MSSISEKLLQSYNQIKEGTTSFLKKNPTPASFINNNIPGGVSGGLQRVQQSFQNPSQYNFYQQAAQGKVPTFQPFKPVGQFVGNYVQNRYIQPVLDIPKNTKTLFAKNTPIVQRGMAGLGLLGGVASFTPDPFQDAVMPIADFMKGFNASAIRGGNIKDKLSSATKAMSLENPVGLGTATTTNKTGEMIGNIAELPLAIGMTGKINKKETLGFDKKVVEMARQGFTPEVKNLIKDFAVQVETSSSPNKKNLGQLGDYIHSLAATLWGEEKTANLTNTQLKNALDVVLKQVDDRAPMGRFYPIGMTARSIRDGEVPPTIKNQTKFVPTNSGKTAFQGESGISMPPKVIGRSINTDSALRESMSTSTSPQDAINKLNQFVGEYSVKADKKQMADLRASLNKEITTLTGGTGDYKKDYAMRAALRNDTEIGGLIRQLESHIDSIDSGTKIKLAKPIKEPMQVFNAEPSTKTTEKLRQKAAVDEFNAWRNQYRENTVSPTQLKNQGVKGMTEAIKTNTTSPASQNPESLTDISGFKAYMRDVYRNFKEVYGNRFDEVKRTVLDPFDKSKGDYVKMNESWASRLKTDIVDGLGIKKKSKESAAVQLYGEGQLPEDQLYAQFGTQKAEKIKKADAWFRESYNQLIDTINVTRKQLYPNSPEKWIAKRKDYYRHFREMQEGVGALFNIFDTPSNISSTLAGISEGTKPKAKFLSLAQQRKGPTTEIDAVGGFIDYIKQASYATHIDKHAERFRALSDELAQNTTESKNLNTFVEYLQDYANDLTGKTNPADRFIQKIIPGGRTTFRALNWINNRVKGNAVIGNVSSALSQIMNVPQGIASAGVGNFTKGIGRTLAGIFSDDPQINKSTFLKERYSDPFSQFNEGIIADTGKFAKWMTGALDNVGSRLIWNAQFEKAKGLNIPNAIKYADDATRSLVAGRGIGEVPLLQKARVTQLFAPFQLEVQNLWWVLKDMKDEKSAGKIITFFIANHLMNKGVEAIRGSDVTFDPIQSMMDGYNSFQEEDNKGKGALKFAGRQAGEVLSNTVGGQTIAALYPEYGATIGDMKLPIRKDFFGKGNPVRQGSGLLAAGALTDPLFKLAPPYGGAQIKKTIDGAKTLMQGYAGEKDKVQYPVKQNAENIIKGLLFGKSGIPETRKYYDENRRPLSDKQSAAFLASNTKSDLYNTFMDKRKASAADDKAKEELKSSNQSVLSKNNKLYIVQENGDIKTIDKTFTPEPVKYTGIQELDKLAVSSYKSKITARYKDIATLLEKGEITREDAIKEINTLNGLKNSVTSGKKKTISDAEMLSAYKKALESANAPIRKSPRIIQSFKPIQLKRQTVKKLR